MSFTPKTMDCLNLQETSNLDYVSAFNRRVAKMRVPISGSVEISRQCNLSCGHCYIPLKQRKIGQTELSTNAWKEILNQIAGAGCLYLLFTGGEPLARADFSELYTHAKNLGLLVSVFTNATRIDQNILELFGDLPPQRVETTLYGATRGVYDSVTRVPGSFDQCMEGIHDLIHAGVRLSLKTVLLASNHHQAEKMREMARGFGASFRVDAGIFPRLNGDPAPLSLRIDPKRAVELEMSDQETRKSWEKNLYNPPPQEEFPALYRCGAGLTNFHVNPQGLLSGCLMIQEPAWDLTQKDFHTGWNQAVAQVRKKPAGPVFPCNSCGDRGVCDCCPAAFLLETGSEKTPGDFSCSIARQRRLALAGPNIEKQENGI